MCRMPQVIVRIVVAAAGVGFLATSAGAQNEPAQAKSIKGSVLTAYEPCTAADTTTADGFPACSTPVRSNPGCGFAPHNGQPHGKGQVQVKTVAGRGWSVKLHVLGLEAACEGEQLDLVVSYRTTARACGDAFCTGVDRSATLASCTVERGSCKTNVPSGTPTLNQADINAASGSELRDLVVTNNGLRTFVIGIVSAGL
jgi:hypothetical protein